MNKRRRFLHLCKPADAVRFSRDDLYLALILSKKPSASMAFNKLLSKSVLPSTLRLKGVNLTPLANPFGKMGLAQSGVRVGHNRGEVR